MKCPACGADNIPGEDTCQSCSESLMSVDGLSAKELAEKSILEDPVTKLQTNPPVVVDRKDTIVEANRKMNEGRVGCAVIVEGRTLAGIITERDILFKVMGEKKDPGKVFVSEVMTADPESLSATDTIAFALNKMAIGGYRHVPVTKNGEILGVVSVRDILSYLAKVLP